ncbi:MAG: hypothetical protein MZV64_43380 [Ignavibacteriales bacterium]|nr:hypothetical protein [Ignavibacteriales bacterium]
MGAGHQLGVQPQVVEMAADDDRPPASATGSDPSIHAITFDPTPSGWCSVTFFIVIVLPSGIDAGVSVLRIWATTSACFLPVPGEQVVHHRAAHGGPLEAP